MTTLEKRAKTLSSQVKSLGNKPYSSVSPIAIRYDFTPKKGVEYLSPSEIQSIKEEIMAGVKADLPDEDALLKKLIDSLKGKLSVNDLADIETFVMRARDGLATKYRVEELMHGGGGTSSSSTSTYNEVVAGSGITWTLANTPASGTLRLFANGQRLTATVDYTLVGPTVTTNNSWGAGTVLADYQLS